MLLASVGYVVDSKTDTYMGDLSSIPSMLTGFIAIMGLIPCVCGIISWLIAKHYPITDAIRSDMQLVLAKRHTEDNV